ncbi:hypothetical protein M8C21_021031 [Ambrosia artemisiifolia]|uniref:APS kinase domain-containing protein n=1 Tax=Ambrosia artemisiifolia TaxID=4212 RepID=A0AAD5BP99_AMBAR|nr:hypothetical protein M8C21_021031 [Ambrosia artemisiifolia]
MTSFAVKFSSIFTPSPAFDSLDRPPTTLMFSKFSHNNNFIKNLTPIKAMEGSRMHSYIVDREVKTNGCEVTNDCHDLNVEKSDRQELLQQRGCVIWITGLSGSGKSTVACALTRILHARGKLTYVLDGEVAKLFADAGIICIASVISPYRKDRDSCRSKLPEGDFIEVFMDIPLCVCEARDPKGLYKLARAGKIKGFTGIDDPYEAPLSSEIVLRQDGDVCPPPEAMAEKVVSYLEAKDKWTKIMV